jgi:hypothetical protein
MRRPRALPWGAGVRLHRAWVARAEVVAGNLEGKEAVEHGEGMVRWKLIFIPSATSTPASSSSWYRSDNT